MTVFDDDQQFAQNLKKYFDIEKPHLIVNGTMTARACRYIIDVPKFIDVVRAKPGNEEVSGECFAYFVLRVYGQEALDWFKVHYAPPTVRDFP